jgi:hypothetical protein
VRITATGDGDARYDLTPDAAPRTVTARHARGPVECASELV